MRSWAQFVEQTPWFVEPGQAVEVHDEQPWTRPEVEGLPVLSALLGAATLTPVTVSGRVYELLAWGARDDRRGWLCSPPPKAPSVGIHPVHARFWTVCGGIVERFGEPESWWLNQDEILTVSAADRPRVADVLDDHAWMWRDAGLSIPIAPDDYYPVAIEANGNLTLVHRDDGQLVLFAPDHAFIGVAPLAGCPPYSLLTIDGAPDLLTWIETCAGAWQDQ